MSADPIDLIARYLDDAAEADEVARLEEALRADPALRRSFVAQAALVGLLSEALRGGAVPGPSVRRAPMRRAGPRAAARPWPRRTVLAAVLAILVAGGGGLVLWTLHRPAPLVAMALTEATVVSWQAAPTVRRDQAALALTAGLGLTAGDHLDTGVDGRLELAWPDGSTTTIAAASTAGIAAGATLALEQGRVEVEVPTPRPGSAPVTITAGDWRVAHLGTAFTVAMTGSPRVTVSAGSVAIRAADAAAVTVRAGQEAVAGTDRRPLVRWELPPLPYGTLALPFAATSPWNAPIPPGTPRADLPTAALTAVPWKTTSDRVQVVAGTARETAVTLRGAGTPLGRVPAFPWPPQGADFLVVLTANGREAWEMYGAVPQGEGVAASRLERVDLAGNGTNGILPSGYPACAGLILGHELRTGIHHALAVFLRPAALAATGLKARDRVALPEDFPASAASGATGVEAAMADALRRHGAIIVGTANETQVGIDPRLKPDVHEQVAAAMTALASHLRRVP